MPCLFIFIFSFKQSIHIFDAFGANIAIECGRTRINYQRHTNKLFENKKFSIRCADCEQ